MILCLMVFSGCKKEKEAKLSSSEIEAESEKLYAFFDREFQTELKESPMLQTELGIKDNYGSWDNFSHLTYAEDQNKAKRRLDFLKDSIDPDALSEDAALSYQLYRRQLQNEIDDYPLRLYNYPVNQVYGAHIQLPSFLIRMHQIDSLEDAQAYLSRLKNFPKVMEEVTKGLELREMNHILPPKFVFSQSIEVSNNVISGKPFEKSVELSPLLADFKEKVESSKIGEKNQKELLLEVQNVMVDSVKPAYEKLISKLQDQSQRATEEHGVWKFPKGEKFYNTVLNRITTTDLSPEELHKIGLEEVARIHTEMEELMSETDFSGSLQDFFKFMREDQQFYFENTTEGRSQYLEMTKQHIDSVQGQLNKLFTKLPGAALLVKPVETFKEKSAPKAFYQAPSLDGSRPGIYFVNLHDMRTMPRFQVEAQAYHFGIPGHHLQIALGQEVEEHPMFRKRYTNTSYTEGWALYAIGIPKEVGFYENPYSDVGRLSVQLWHAIGLVVDTGIHSKKWTREEAVEYYMSNSPTEEKDAVKIVEHHIVRPGQAAASTVGMLKILELRTRARNELKDEFDPRAFHNIILEEGPIPLDLLEQRVNQWLEKEK